MVDGVELVPREEALDRGQVLGRDTQDDKMLVRCRAERALVHLGDLAETGLEVLLGLVLDASVLDEAGEVVFPILAGDPTEVIDVFVERERTGRLELVSKELLDCRFEVVEAHAVDRVLETSIL